MYWVILISFLSLLAISFVVSRPGNKLIKNKKNKVHLFDVLSSYMGGFLLVIIVYLFVSASNGKETFDIGIDFFNSNRWNFAKFHLLELKKSIPISNVSLPLEAETKR